jgi:hypothetical protein
MSRNTTVESDGRALFCVGSDRSLNVLLFSGTRVMATGLSLSSYKNKMHPFSTVDFSKHSV